MKRAFAIACLLTLSFFCLSSSASAQTPTYYDDPTCYAGPCQLHMTEGSGGTMTGTVQVYSLFYGDWSADMDAAQTTADFFTDLNGSTYLNLMSLYGASTDIQFMGNFFAPSDAATTAGLNGNNEARVYQMARSFAQSVTAPGDPVNTTNAVYFIFTAPDIQLPRFEQEAECGYHDDLGGTAGVKYAFIYSAEGCGDTLADGLTYSASHELFETLTDPNAEAVEQDDGGWRTWDGDWEVGGGDEVVDPCENTSFQGTLNGQSFALQPVFVNDSSYAAGGYCSSELPFATTAGVPEPKSWALMIGGFGLVGVSLRRRRARVSGGIMLNLRSSGRA